MKTPNIKRHRDSARGGVIGAIAFAVVILANSSANAQDKELGQYLSGQCITCHQASGKSNGIPAIIGWDSDSFVAIMDSYKKKERENKVMQTIAASLSREEITALAAYFGSLKSKP
ncbi:MAG TPA: c-type cytochrome [Hyphomicrobiaceae bacterium]|nr:c-type cytochrome [Hyphomicrobiaceae bacterium]